MSRGVWTDKLFIAGIFTDQSEAMTGIIYFRILFSELIFKIEVSR